MAVSTFITAARRAFADPQLQRVLGGLARGAPQRRRDAVAAVPNFEALRERARAIKDHSLEYLDEYLEQFEAAVDAAGGEVHWAADGAQLNEIVLELCRAAGAQRVVKGKSMVSEESGLNVRLLEAGLEVVETDLGEYIVQLAGEPPSHILGPAIHKTMEQVGELFLEHHALGERTFNEPEALVKEARQVLRERFLAAEVGIIGANSLIAEDGSVMLVTNEGNGDLSSCLPKVQIVVASIEKVVPSAEDAAAILRVLVPSGTGQSISAYTSFYCGPRRKRESEGPEQFHVVLLDNRRSEILSGPYRSMLRCIRCSACLNHCPIYRHAGGHSYGSVYPGPMGSVLTPLLTDKEQGLALAEACTTCGRCEEVCPVKIPLPEHLRRLRSDAYSGGQAPLAWRGGIGATMALLRRPALYGLATRALLPVLRLLAKRPRVLRRVPGLSGWTASRDLPQLPKQTFLQQWAARAKEQQR